MLFAAVVRLDEELNAETLLNVRDGKIPNLLSGYTETNSIKNKRRVYFVFEKVNKK
jgi:hypothetical protein